MFKTIVSVAAVAAIPAIASAHVTLVQGEAPADSYYLAQLQIPHGCDGKATKEVRVTLPEGFISAKPMPKAGWTLEIVKGKYKTEYKDHGKPVTEGPLAIHWKGGDLPDDNFDIFSVRGKFAGLASGSVVPFAVTQLCDGAEAVWNEVAAPGQDAHDLPNPAPTVTLIAAKDMHHHHDAAPAPITLGSLDITPGFIKATTPGQPVAGGFLTIANRGAEDDTLVAVEGVEGVDHVELHTMSMEGDVMKMRKLSDGIPVPAGQTVELKPGGLHLMFMGLKHPYLAGETTPMTLVFAKAGKVAISLPVMDIKGGMDKHTHK
jgi:periplasmic copper chaperone A